MAQQPNALAPPSLPSALTVAFTYPDVCNPAATYLASLKSENSRRVMLQTLRRTLTMFFNCELEAVPPIAVYHFAWHNIRYQHVNLIRARLIEQFAPAVVNRHLSAIRGVVKECWRLEYIDAETFRRAVDVQNLKFDVIPAGRDIPEREFRALLMTCYADKNIGVRDLAIMALLATTGLRRAELARLTLADFNQDDGLIKVLFGKGGKQRTVYAQNRTLDLVREWLVVRGDFEGALFTSVLKNGKVTENPLPASALYRMITDRAIRAGISKVTPHDFRRKFVGDMLDRNIDMVMIAKITGHSDARMLARYDRRTEEAKKAAAAKIDLPI